MSRFKEVLLVPIMVAGCLLDSSAANPSGQPNYRQQAWELLRTGVQDSSTELRATTVGVLSLLRGEAEAIRMARKALDDGKAEVRAAAAASLGELHDAEAIPKLKATLEDKEPAVVLAAAHALVELGDPSGYEVYYAILTGQRKSGRGLVAGQLESLKDPKKLAELGLFQGLGFIPFAGLGYKALKAIVQSDSSPGRAAAAKILTKDPDPDTDDALVQVATTDKSEIVRAAALDAIARRDRPALIPRIAPAMEDDKDSVKYTAAAAVIRLSDIRVRRGTRKK